MHRLTPVKFSPVSGPAELALPDSVIADLSSDQLLLYQLYTALQTGNIAPKEACNKIGPVNHALLSLQDKYAMAVQMGCPAFLAAAKSIRIVAVAVR